MSERDEDRYRLSDGRDAREVASALERVAEQEEARPATALERAVPPLKLWRGERTVSRAAQAQMEQATEDDWEALLRATNARGWSKPRPPGTLPTLLESEQVAIKLQVTHGTGVSALLESEGAFLRAVRGIHEDTRDADTIAEQFLRRVDGLTSLHGDERLDEHIARARDDVLEGVPEGYRRKVLERLLAREEALASTPDEADALKASRDDRRSRGWQALTGKDAPGRG